MIKEAEAVYSSRELLEEHSLCSEAYFSLSEGTLNG